MLKKTMLVLMAAISLGAAGCYYDKEELLYPGGSNCQTPANRFSDVQPIIQTKCAFNSSCHAAGSSNVGGAFTSYDLIKAKASHIKLQVQTGLMPQQGSPMGGLTPTELQSIVCWIDAGALNN